MPFRGRPSGNPYSPRFPCLLSHRAVGDACIHKVCQTDRQDNKRLQLNGYVPLIPGEASGAKCELILYHAGKCRKVLFIYQRVAGEQRKSCRDIRCTPFILQGTGSPMTDRGIRDIPVVGCTPKIMRRPARDRRIRDEQPRHPGCRWLQYRPVVAQLAIEPFGSSPSKGRGFVPGGGCTGVARFRTGPPCRSLLAARRLQRVRVDAPAGKEYQERCQLGGPICP